MTRRKKRHGNGNTKKEKHMKEQKEVKVSKMVIQLSEEQISLSMPEAKKLHEALDELFGKKADEHVYHNDYWYRPYRWFGDTYVSARSALGAMNGGRIYEEVLCASQEYKGANASFSANGTTLLCDLTK
jgi:hypothetical protein